MLQTAIDFYNLAARNTQYVAYAVLIYPGQMTFQYRSTTANIGTLSRADVAAALQSENTIQMRDDETAGAGIGGRLKSLPHGGSRHMLSKSGGNTPSGGAKPTDGAGTGGASGGAPNAIGGSLHHRMGKRHRH